MHGTIYIQHEFAVTLGYGRYQIDYHWQESKDSTANETNKQIKAKRGKMTDQF